MVESPFRIYNASAGSGKTHTLTKEYLKIVLSSPKSFGKILALTFTNKAVGEMKHRILDSLYQFGHSARTENTTPLFLAVKDELGLDTETLRERAGNTLREILHNYAFFDISTIDKFTHRLIRTFAKDLKLPQNFEVVLDNELLLDEAVSRLILKAGTEPLLTKVLVDFALEKIEDNKSWDVAIDLNKVGKLLFSENHAGHVEKLKDKTIADFLELKATLLQKIETLTEQMAREASRVLQLLEENGLEFTDFTRSSFPNFMQKIALADPKISFNEAWKQNFGDRPLYNKSCPEGTKSIIDRLQQDLAKSFMLLKERFSKVSFLRNAYGNVIPLMVLNSIQLELKKVQEERGLLSISEFNSIISKEIKDQPAPFIYERLGEKYRHYFIDEFQDTSATQWENLVPLVGNALESGDGQGKTGSLFLVGDAKQAIYRWRGGRAEQFLDLLSRRENPFVFDPKIEPLPKNYRSCEEIIKFNNDFFTATSPFLNNELYRQLFKEGNDQQTNNKKGGYVQLTFIDEEAGTTVDELYAKAVLQIIGDVMHKGHARRDICILVRNNREGVALADFLTQKGVPVVSSESLLLDSSEKVRFLVDLLRYLDQPEDPAIVYRILSYLSKGSPERHRFISENIGKLEDLLPKRYGFDPNMLRLKSVYDGLELAIRQFDLADDTDAFIVFFMDVVLEVENREGTGTQVFLDYWDKKKKTLGLSAPANLDALKIMTVHKAKGLEFPVVIFPYADGHIYKRMDKKLWLPVKKEDYSGFEELPINEKKEVVQYGALAHQLYSEEENKMELDSFNVLYVALTRAEKALFVISKKQLDRNGGHNIDHYSGLFIHYLKEKGLWDNVKSTYTFGALDVTNKAAIDLQEPVPYQYTYKERPGFNILTSSGNLWETEREAALSRGNLVHYAMSLVETEDDVAPALQVLTRSGDIGQGELEAIRSTMGQIIAHPKLAGYFKEGQLIKNEKDILTESGHFLRPDRLVINGKQLTILDYKTGKKDPTYHQQLYAYGDALEQMGFIVENKIIVYIDENIIPEFI